MTALQRITTAVQSTPDLDLAVIFGSTARERTRRESDIDLGIAMAPGSELPSSVDVNLERLGGRPVSITRLETAPPLLRFEIARDGVVLLEREAGRWARFRAQAMIDWWDWAPTVRMMQRIVGRRLREEAERGSA